MKQTKKEIESKFYQLLRCGISKEKFENWLYNSKEIEVYYGDEFYLSLISVNYKGKYAINETEKIICGKIPYGEFEKERLGFILNSIILGNGDLAELLAKLYDDYCDGYNFLRYLGLSYILNGIDEKGLPDTLKVKIEENLKSESKRILGFINSGEIKITDEYQYEDFRKYDDRIEINNFEKMF